MQTLEFANKKSTSNKKNQQKVKQIVVDEEYENKREGKGRLLATSKRVYRIQNSDTFYVESETSDNIFYFVRFMPSVFEWCSCLDNSTRHIKCKHIFAVEYSITKGTLQDVEKLPSEVKRDNMVPESYRDDDYDF